MSHSSASEPALRSFSRGHAENRSVTETTRVTSSLRPRRAARLIDLERGGDTTIVARPFVGLSAGFMRLTENCFNIRSVQPLFQPSIGSNLYWRTGSGTVPELVFGSNS